MEAYWHYPLDSDSKGNFSDIKVILVDNNEGFVALAVASCQAELHEEFTMALKALEDAKYNFKCITSLVPEGSEVHKVLIVINTQIKAAYRVAKSANLTMGTADVVGTPKAPGIMLPPGQQLLVPRKRRKISSTQSIPTAGGGGESESDDNLQTQEVDPKGGVSKQLLSLEIPVTKICVRIKFSDIKCLKLVYPVSIYMHIDTG